MNTFTKILISLGILTVTVAGLYLYVKKGDSKPTPASETHTLVMETETLSVEVTYPVIPGSTSSIKQANEFIRNDIDRKIQDFESDARDGSALGFDLPKDVKSYVVGGPSVKEDNERYIAIFMGMEWYMLGAAHPFHTIDTYVYDYQNGKLVAAEDMFNSGSEYLELLSKYSYQGLFMQSKQGDVGLIFNEEMVAEGVKPTRENFSRILPTDDGLVIYFNEYQVAPYAAGYQQVTISYENLADVIDPNGVLGIHRK